MKRFRFSLETVLRLKNQFLRQAELNVLTAQLKVESIKKKIDQIHKSIAEIDDTTDKPSWLMIAGDQHMKFCRTQLTQLRQELAPAWAELEEVKAACSAIKQEVEALMKLKQSQIAKYRAELDHDRQIKMDDVVMRKWIVDPSPST